MHTTSIRDFKKEKILGKGSFGSVYLVRRRQDNKIYALKTVILEKLNKKEQENSVNEVRILASINHPNVIGYKEAFWDDEKSALNIVMEYADDGDLHSKIEKMKKAGGYFKESIIWSYAIQMIEGLKALHDKKIMHRDLKSANIFLVKDKHQCKLGDMNVSKVIKEKVLHTQTGTPYYASPEVWNDAPYSYKSDLWSIGCVIYELCNLRPPFQGKDLDELYENVCKGKPERINKAYSDELWKMILMLLQVDVNKRVDCNKFLNSDLIRHKMEEMKKDPNFGIEAFIYNKNKDIENDYLLETIKFSDIKEIKAQLPTKKNYNNNILFSNKIKCNNNKSIKNNNKEDELLNKKIKENNNEKNSLKPHKTEIYKKNNSLSNNLPIPENHINLNSGRKTNNTQNSDQIKKLDMYKLYLKKYANKINYTNINLCEERCQTPTSNYSKIFNNKLINNIPRCDKRINIPHQEKKSNNNNCLTNIERKKNNNKILEQISFKEKEKTGEIIEIKNPCNTIEYNNFNINNKNSNNTYIYNKPNIIIKKNNSLTNNRTIERPGSATPIYKRAAYLSNIPVSNSFITEKNKNGVGVNLKSRIPKLMINSPIITNKRKMNEEKDGNNFLNKLNKYFSYDNAPINIQLKNNSKNKENKDKNINKIPINNTSKLNDKNQYIKKINIKSYKQKLKSLENDNFYEKREMYGKMYEKEKKEVGVKNKKTIGNEILLTNKSNEFLKRIKPINIREGNQILNCYLSPKNNKSQIFNNFYSINLPAPVKVINVFKK